MLNLRVELGRLSALFARLLLSLRSIFSADGFSPIEDRQASFGVNIPRVAPGHIRYALASAWGYRASARIVIVLCLEKALSYDNQGRQHLKRQAIRINDSPHRLRTCSRASGAIETGPRGTTFLSASVRAGVFFQRATHALARGLASLLNAGHMPP